MEPPCFLAIIAWCVRNEQYSTFLQYLDFDMQPLYNAKWEEVHKMRKTEAAVQRCKTMSMLQKILGGKWKLEILYYIAFCDIRRFGELRRQLGEITESSLTKQLRELEADGFLIRHDFQELPLRVEYQLSDLGRSFMDVIAYMKAWGEQNLPETTD